MLSFNEFLNISDKYFTTFIRYCFTDEYMKTTNKSYNKNMYFDENNNLKYLKNMNYIGFVINNIEIGSICYSFLELNVIYDYGLLENSKYSNKKIQQYNIYNNFILIKQGRYDQYEEDMQYIIIIKYKNDILLNIIEPIKDNFLLFIDTNIISILYLVKYYNYLKILKEFIIYQKILKNQNKSFLPVELLIKILEYSDNYYNIEIFYNIDKQNIKKSIDIYENIKMDEIYDDFTYYFVNTYLEILRNFVNSNDNDINLYLNKNYKHTNTYNIKNINDILNLQDITIPDENSIIFNYTNYK
jgi:hypothetical protein